ncbi:MAG: PIN domain-containing protein [Bacteroidetes bacterium]|jgi:tRNA(fMet)-specific endonuclease VapC|nr:PIN domain-containing protein [Bacteroidota bacterium]
MMRYLLDTNVLSEPVRSTPEAQVVATLRSHSTELATTSIVWHELIYGAERLPEGEKRTYLFTYLTEVVRTTVP